MSATAAIESEAEPELVRLLMRLGYFAAWNGLHREAMTIFDGVRAVRPSSEIPVVGAAVVAMLMGNHQLAVDALRDDALTLNPDSDLAKAHLGSALRLQGREAEGCSLLRGIAESSDDPDARAMAANVLAIPAATFAQSDSA